MNRPLVLAILCAHLLLVVMLTLLRPSAASTQEKKQPLTVRTVVVSRPAPVESISRPSRTPVRQSKPSRNKLVSKMRSELARLQPAKPPVVAPIQTAPVGPLLIDETDLSSYSQDLAKRLRSVLTLPEYGSVKIALNVARDGRVASVEIVDSYSTRNAAYVMEVLPGLRLPPLLNGESHTFHLTLRNDL